MAMSAARPVVALCYVNFGPYHWARYRQCRRDINSFEVRGVQMAREQAEYAWKSDGDEELVTVEQKMLREDVPAKGWRDRVAKALDALQPDCCAVAGYSDPSMLAAIQWCWRHGRPIVLMSDSTAWDAPRTWWKERIKGQIVAGCDAGFAAGEPHAEYLNQLGMPRAKISLGYDVVDNQHFATGASAARADADARRARLGLPRDYFLATARFIPKKNLPGLLRAYATYRRLSTADAGSPQTPWDLVLLGNGPMRGELESLRESLRLTSYVQLPGFLQYDELPQYYGLAQALIHPSTVDQWGLVVNEAMAASLPVLVSDRCGCASSLVRHGENGFTFDPRDEQAMADLMMQMTALSDDERRRMGRRSAELAATFGLDRFTDGLATAVDAALSSGPSRPRRLGSLTLRAITLAAR